MRRENRASGRPVARWSRRGGPGGELRRTAPV